ncbi:MAG: hypothetical protein HQK89_10370 [Nitrospirae bacterium]|nr:hypothetical protein [Nitrospirota bacterium]
MGTSLPGASRAWPLPSLRQSFLNGSLTRLIDPDTVLKGRIPGFVGRGDFGLASGRKPDGTFGRVWYKEQISSDEVSFDENVFLVKKDKALACQITPLTSSRQVPTWSMPKNEPSSGTKLPHQQEPDKVPEPSQIPEESDGFRCNWQGKSQRKPMKVPSRQ